MVRYVNVGENGDVVVGVGFDEAKVTKVVTANGMITVAKDVCTEYNNDTVLASVEDVKKRYYEIKAMQKRMKELKEEYNRLSRACEKGNEIIACRGKHIAYNVKVEYLAERYEPKIVMAMKSVTGDEQLGMCSVNSILDKCKAIAIIRKSKRDCVYSFGQNHFDYSTLCGGVDKAELERYIWGERDIEITFGNDIIRVFAYK